MERPSTTSRRSTPLMTPGSAGGMRASAAIRLGTALTPGTAMRMGTAGGADFGERPMTSNKVGADLIAAGVLCDTVKEEQHLQCLCHCRGLCDLVGFWPCCVLRQQSAASKTATGARFRRILSQEGSRESS